MNSPRFLSPIGILLAVMLLMLISNACQPNKQYNEDTENTETKIQEIRYEYGIPIDSFSCVNGTVQQGETLGGIFSKIGASAQNIKELTLVDRNIFDVRSIRPGKNWLAFYDKDSLLHYFVYRQDAVQSIVFHLADTLHIERQQKDITYCSDTCRVTIESSLWNAFVNAGTSPQLAIELSDIYAWTVDFFGLQKGDCFVVYYDQAYADTLSIGISRIHAAAYVHNNDTLYAFYYDNNDIHGYFDCEGKSLKKAFLKAPLNYKRISSTFTYNRVHPIYKTVRPHTGVDYAAPMGTPVVAIGDGVVTEKGYKGGGGNTVKIRHNSTYTTAYLHLSKYGKDIQVGKRVQQGQIIGYVGSTGSSTGPHLDFRVWKNGTPINPLTMEAPPVEPIPDKYKQEFDSVANALKQHLY
ncbi:MAG: peptidoglycan DD-metalloendopeptidase family protein [Paludibacter sp.]|nr:peptidoglycan DD-metalloendopeptidase family protein [Bacteroidales bacterium]MCM1068876.1 peptidoglycan DD-metalloendopeptidase family protein [Prevotella sp.]MCM1353137.1 peptidoglycan DD-metalloendopeptidase family protein [Bacteroides sp.]MCM1442459.1 peptidoglycan DD-metalloendopeptidase family protein [Muribaculum sp.]MCM1481302.1 peptidoglycan DD-metalloendopeptidase family protein [Paludibacter sp.]